MYKKKSETFRERIEPQVAWQLKALYENKSIMAEERCLVTTTDQKNKVEREREREENVQSSHGRKLDCCWRGSNVSYAAVLDNWESCVYWLF